MTINLPADARCTGNKKKDIPAMQKEAQAQFDAPQSRNSGHFDRMKPPVSTPEPGHVMSHAAFKRILAGHYQNFAREAAEQQ